MKVEFEFGNDLKLMYQLNDTETSNSWSRMLAMMRPVDMLRLNENHIHGFATDDLISKNIERLSKVVADLSFELPLLTEDNWQDELSKLHINLLNNLGKSNDKRPLTMNLLIHWLEYELMNVYQNKQQYIVNCDFNHSPETYNIWKRFPDNELNMFSPNLEFGNLHCHYVMIGRHFLELFDAKDFVCPKQQFVPQTIYNATRGLVFSEPSSSELVDQMRQYYDERGGISFFGFEFDDPLMRKGFFKLGQLENVSEFDTKEKRDDLRNQIKDSEIINWTIMGL